MGSAKLCSRQSILERGVCAPAVSVGERKTLSAGWISRLRKSHRRCPIPSSAAEHSAACRVTKKIEINAHENSTQKSDRTNMKNDPAMLIIFLLAIIWVFGMDFAPDSVRYIFIIYLRLENILFSTEFPNVALFISKHLAVVPLICLSFLILYMRDNTRPSLGYQNIVKYLKMRGLKVTTGKMVFRRVALMFFLGLFFVVSADYFMYFSLIKSNWITPWHLVQSDCAVLLFYMLIVGIGIVLPSSWTNRNEIISF